MRVVIQRVKEASVTIEGKMKSSIGKGLLILVGIENEDNSGDIEWIAKKVCQLRVFDDNDGVMNLSVLDVKGDILAVSQFTLQAKTKKGNRPSYIKAAQPEISVPIYEEFIKKLEEILQKPVGTGEFGAQMDVALINEGPVTILIDSKNKDM
jgi:D-aminoacyl-tRNA deacylase